MEEKKIDVDHLGLELTELRTAKGWSREKLMVYSGLCKSTIFCFENGTKSPCFEKFMEAINEMGYTTEIAIDDPIQGETWTDPEGFPELLRYLMEDRGITAQEFAKEMGVVTKTIYNWWKKISFRNFYRACCNMDIPVRVYLVEK